MNEKAKKALKPNNTKRTSVCRQDTFSVLKVNLIKKQVKKR